MDNEDISLNITKRLPILIICFIGEVILVALTLYAKILLNVQDHTFFCYSAIYGLGLGVFILVTWWKKEWFFYSFPCTVAVFSYFPLWKQKRIPFSPSIFVFLTYVFCFCLFRNPSNWGLLHPGPPSERATVWRSPTRCATGQLSTGWGVGCFRCLARSTHIDTKGFEKAKFEECLLSLWRR